MTMTILQPDGAVHIWLVNLEQVPEARLEDYRALLSEDERDRLQNYKNPKVRLSQLITRAAVRVCLSQYAEDVTPEAWQFERNEAGKPQLVQAPRPLSFNLSHSGDWLAIAVTLTTPLGVDVQFKTTRPAHLELARRYFHPEEVRELEACQDEAERLERFFYFWTLKEAYFKARGTGISTGLEKVRFDTNAQGQIVATLAAELNDDASQWQFHHYQLEDDYRLALAVNRPQPQHVEPEFYRFVPLESIQPLYMQAHRIQTRSF